MFYLNVLVYIFFNYAFFKRTFDNNVIIWIGAYKFPISIKAVLLVIGDDLRFRQRFGGHVD